MIHLLPPPVKTNAQPPLLISLTGHVGHAPGRRDPVDAVLIGGTGVQVAEAAPRCSAGQDKAGLAIPGGLADVEAGREIPVERGAASGQHERVGGRKADLLDRRAPEVSVAEPAVVAGAGYHRDMVSGRSQQDGVHLGHLSLGEVMFPQAEADQRHVGAGDGQPQSGDHVGGRVRGAVRDVGGQQDHPESGGGGDRVHDLGVLDFLVSRLPWRACAGQGGHDLDPRGGQPEHAVECRQILAYIAGRRDSRRRGYRGVGGRGAGGRGQRQGPSPSRRGRRSPCPARAGCHTRPGTGPGHSRRSGEAGSRKPRRPGRPCWPPWPCRAPSRPSFPCIQPPRPRSAAVRW